AELSDRAGADLRLARLGGTRQHLEEPDNAAGLRGRGRGRGDRRLGKQSRLWHGERRQRKAVEQPFLHGFRVFRAPSTVGDAARRRFNRSETSGPPAIANSPPAIKSTPRGRRMALLLGRLGGTSPGSRPLF